MNYYGDFAEDATVYIPFNTFSSDDPQASVTITNLVDADIKVHKDGSTTQITTDGATIAIDFDTITGNHLITIDTSVSADYATGSDYLVRIEGTTVDAGTINAFIGSFSIENRYQHGTAQTGDSFARLGAPAGASVSADIANVPTTTEISDSVWDESLSAHQTVLSAGRALTLGGVPIAETTAAGTPTTSAIQLTAGSSTDDFYSDQTLKIVGGAAAGQARIITNYIGSTKTCEFDEPLAIAPSNGDAIAIALDHLHSRTQVADSVWSSTTRVLTAGTNLNDLSAAQVNAECDTAISDANLATAAALATVDSNVDAILIDTGTTLPAQITGLNDISTADILASGDVDGYSIEETLKLLGAASYGTLSGAATTTVTITAPDASKPRLTATVDADGNRSAVVKDATG